MYSSLRDCTASLLFTHTRPLYLIIAHIHMVVKNPTDESQSVISSEAHQSCDGTIQSVQSHFQSQLCSTGTLEVEVDHGQKYSDPVSK